MYLLLLLFLVNSAPHALRVRGSEYPFFVAANAAVDDSGIPNPGLFDEGSRQLLRMKIEHGRAADAGPCDVRIVSPHEWWSAGARPWEEITAASRAAVRGKVVSATPGFQHLSPVTLLTIRIEDAVFASVPFPRSGLIHVIYPSADFHVGGARFCQVPRSDFVPVPGDEILVLAASSPSDESGSFVTPIELIFSREGRLFVPDSVSDRERLLGFRSLAKLPVP